MQRVGVFVNVSNQFASLNAKNKGFRVNYAEYLRYINDQTNSEITLSIAYVSQVNNESESFIEVLSQLGYVIKFSKAKREQGTIIHPNRNVEMAMDIIEATEKLDTIVLGTNDLDLIPLIWQLRTRGIKVFVITPVLTHSEGTINIDISPLELLVQDMKGKRDATQKGSREGDDL